MIAAFADLWAWPDKASETTAPDSRKPKAPVFIGDILTARSETPEFLIRWREAKSIADRD